jgi:crossover junction endodeoxyribonuclease RuvC
MRILAVDPSLRSTGFGIIEKVNNTMRALAYGTIRNEQKLLPSGCLLAIHEQIAALIQEHAPDCAVFEAIIYVQSHRTAITLGSARGAALLAAASKGLPIYEYAPRRVKQSVVGRGAADKSQVGFMVRALLGLTETPPADVADALAIGLTHLRTADTAARGVTMLQRI